MFSSRQTCTLLGGSQKRPPRSSAQTSQGYYPAANNHPGACKSAAKKRGANPAIPSLRIDISNVSYTSARSARTGCLSTGKSSAGAKGQVNVSYIDLRCGSSANKKPEPTPSGKREGGKCLLGGALSKSMTDLRLPAAMPRSFSISRRVSNPHSESLTPQVSSHPSLLLPGDRSVLSRVASTFVGGLKARPGA